MPAYWFFETRFQVVDVILVPATQIKILLNSLSPGMPLLSAGCGCASSLLQRVFWNLKKVMSYPALKIQEKLLDKSGVRLGTGKSSVTWYRQM